MARGHILMIEDDEEMIALGELILEKLDAVIDVLAKATGLIHQTSDAPAYDLYVPRSFAEYLWRWLEDAAAEYGVTVLRRE